jgi:hypothetical protein
MQTAAELGGAVLTTNVVDDSETIAANAMRLNENRTNILPTLIWDSIYIARTSLR